MEDFIPFMTEQISPLINQLLMTVFTALFTYLGYKAKKFMDRKEIQEGLKNNQELAMMAVKYVQQVGEHIANSEKLKLAKVKLTELAENQGISISDNEKDVLVESALISFKEGMKKDSLIIEDPVKIEEPLEVTQGEEQ